MSQKFSFKRLALWWDWFLFAPADLAAIRFFRVALAFMLAWNFWPQHLELAKQLRHKPLLFNLYEKVIFTAPYHALLAALLFLLAFGWRAQIIGALLLLLLLPLDFLTVQQQSRQIMLFTLLAFCFLPGDSERFLRSESEVSAPPMWPIRLMQIQLTLVYGINAFVKTTPHFLSGEALILMSQHLPNFRVDFSDGFLHLARISIPIWVLACATVLTETFLATAFWLTRRRVWVALIGVAFHFILKFVVQIGMLDWVSMFLYLTFLLPFERRDTGSTPDTNKT